MIPEEFIKTNLEKAKNITFLGIPLEKLSRDELLACVVIAYEDNKNITQELARERDFLMSLRGK